ncbi:gephyrin-like molybdotransferase Glp [Marivita sp. XM-24bin2]|uniref:molybdopterin molybdotransferase MoeA n=1 Tax=unclassified Marivita TaxID=2632480 RepID=UPI000D7A55D8|nr:gephyrin-like molybdotransferase Glp [Marivita sp. XM-24bin2]MCR9108736.1 molybdopterin molybdotransferase MoeA [Paracoccaceae bacterium]PWL35923.1 MAG: molybdopterin molybdenumtransferase MoeA [Marivita sp. XM-24bin2]
MISVAEALDQLFALAPPLGVETVPLLQGHRRVLAQDVAATREQPPFDGAAMDGYAVTEVAPGLRLKVIGESAAGHGFYQTVKSGEAVRIFTGAPVPEGARAVVIQEDVVRDGDWITIGDTPEDNDHIRPAGGDFKIGDSVRAGRVLGPNDIALLASMNIAEVPVTRRPIVALISTGDELVMPGEAPGPDQIIASNALGLHALMRDLGAKPRLLPIARDNEASLRTAFDLAKGADLIVTIGGASVGDHDVVANLAPQLGFDQSFYKVAMRPGKPLMAGRFGNAMMIGLPGNPVSAMVCGHVFVAPVVRAMLGLPAQPAPRRTGILAEALPQNGPREHYMRARMTDAGLIAFGSQDSSLLSVLGQADALIVRAPRDGPRDAGDSVEYLPLR